MGFDESPDRDELQVLADYIFKYQRGLLDPAELTGDYLAILRMKSTNAMLMEHRLCREQDRIGPDTWKIGMTNLTDSPDTDLATLDLDTARQLWIALRRRAAQRILDTDRENLEVARCPKCERVLNTPKAQQCFVCDHDWHARPDTP